MDIVYNGVHLTMCSIEEYSEQVVMDPTKTDYLFTRHRIVGKAVANGQVEVREVAGPPVSYKKTSRVTTADQMERDTAPDGVVTSGAGTASVGYPFAGVPHDPRASGLLGSPPRSIYASPKSSLSYFAIEPAPNPVPLTAIAIRHRLSVPRAQLFVFAGTGLTDELILRSPSKPSRHCDANNGPKPLGTELIYTKGEAGTHLFQFGIETFVNESEDNVVGSKGAPGSATPLLSNRFSMRHLVSEDQITVIQVEGEAYFRTDLLFGDDTTPPTSPDDLRSRLFLPVPFGFVREHVAVEGMAEGNGVRYSFQDRQMPVNFPGGAVWGIPKITAVHTQAIITDGDLIEGAAAAFNGMTQAMLNRKWLNESKATATPQPPARTSALRTVGGSGGASSITARPAPPPVPRRP